MANENDNFTHYAIVRCSCGATPQNADSVEDVAQWMVAHVHSSCVHDWFVVSSGYEGTRANLQCRLCDARGHAKNRLPLEVSDVRVG